MSRRPFLVNGTLSRDPQQRSYFRHINGYRLCVILSILLILTVTNPANEDYLRKLLHLSPSPSPYRTTTSSSSSSSSSSSRRTTYTIPQQNQNQRRITNYGIFSIKEQIGSITIQGLGNYWICPHTDTEIGPLCDVIALNLSHQKPLLWDPKDRSHTAHRIICALLILSTICFYCYRPQHHPTTAFVENDSILHWLLSVLYRPNLIIDLWNMNTCIYPTLVEMNRIIPRLTPQTSYTSGNVDLDYAVTVFVFLFGMGGCINWMATKVTKRPVYGFFTTVSISLAYYQRVTRNRTLQTFLLQVMGQPVTPGTAYMTGLAMIILSSPPGYGVARVVAWILAGCAGSLLGQYHLENQIWWSSLADTFRLI